MRRDASLRKSEGKREVIVRSHAGGAGGGTQERVRPVRRRPKRSVWRKTILPMVGYSLVLACVVVVVSEISKPFMLYDREKKATDTIQQQLNDCKAQNVELERKIKYLQTAEGQAQAARELGWVKPGEITLVIPNKQPTAKP